MSDSIKEIIKKMFHRHKYTKLRMYPPRKQYNEIGWGFLIECDCGHKKLTTTPRSITSVYCDKPIDDKGE